VTASGATLGIDPVEVLQRLIRFDTTNPPGNERDCIAYLGGLLDEAGIAWQMLGARPERANLVARVPGRGLAPSLLLHGHADVVPTEGQTWSHPPLEGRLVGGEVWGRGALDMKGGVVMMLAALLRARAEGGPAGDVVLAVVADEEFNGTYGARYLVEQHPGLFEGVREAIGEDGGAGLELAGLRFHPIVVAEKRACWLRLTLRGPGGHASRAAGDAGTVPRLGRMLAGLGGGTLAPRVIPTVERMLAELAEALPPAQAALVRRLPDPDALAALPPADASYLTAVLHDTANATVLRASSKINVIPANVTVELDGRLLPGVTTEEYLAALTARMGELPGMEILYDGETMPEPRLGAFYELLARILRARDPQGVPLPMLTTGATDARYFARLGIATYGWMPLLLPTGGGHRATLHAADERIPVDALAFGIDCLTDLLRSPR
jgi:acetylornithine deacetylase/succinyl-diaminopimelate desuccinylase-like protein